MSERSQNEGILTASGAIGLRSLRPAVKYRHLVARKGGDLPLDLAAWNREKRQMKLRAESVFSRTSPRNASFYRNLLSLGAGNPTVGPIGWSGRFRGVPKVAWSALVKLRVRRLCSASSSAYDDWATLKACLQSLTQLTNGPSFEVIIVDDGSTEAVPEFICSSNYRYPLNLIRQSHAGIPTYRNRGIRASKGAVLLFVDAPIRRT